MSNRAQIEIPTEPIAELCMQYKVRELALFGSVLRNDFQPSSDIDVLASFAPGSEPNIFELAAMRRELERIMGRKVDLVDRRVIEEDANYIRRRQILESAEILYAA
jgi:uncharacterized protein